MRILLLGGSGQVGWELLRTLLPLGEIIAPDRKHLDLSDTRGLTRYLQNTPVDVIVNAAAYTAVDQAETDQAAADCINHHVPSILAEHARKNQALLIHYSTDYIFDGSKSGPYNEQDQPNPLGIYGRTKLAGETAVQQSGCDYLIFRTSWVFAARGRNFLRTIRRLIQEREQLEIVADQFGAPTWARLIAETTAHCLHRSDAARRQGRFVSGLYHLSAAGATSWFGFALAVVNQLRLDGNIHIVLQHINPISTAEYPVPARRPANSRLDVTRLEKHFELVMPDWNHTLQLCMDELKD